MSFKVMDDPLAFIYIKTNRDVIDEQQIFDKHLKMAGYLEAPDDEETIDDDDR